MRKLILSRKGFDTQYGEVPSPIFPDGSVYSLPIPYPNASLRYEDIRFAGGSLGTIVADLRGAREPMSGGAHLDPDLVAEARPRPPGWRPSFGQIGNAQAHLANQGVGPGDLFLFFGLFRPVERCAGQWRYVRAARPRHLIFGWLQVEAVHRVNMALARRLPWAVDHPHLADAWTERDNTLYVAAEELVHDGRMVGVAGAGVVHRVHDDLVLTAPGESPSVWRLPAWLMADGRVPALSYHERSPERWTRADDGVRLRTVGKGQEFVLDLDRHPEAAAWAVNLLQRSSG